jgi:hypothetical protein
MTLQLNVDDFVMKNNEQKIMNIRRFTSEFQMKMHMFNDICVRARVCAYGFLKGETGGWREEESCLVGTSMWPPPLPPRASPPP